MPEDQYAEGAPDTGAHPLKALQSGLQIYDAVVERVTGRTPEALALLLTRAVLGGVFWRSGQTKVEAGSFFQLKASTVELFGTEYAAVSLPAELAAPMASAAEHILPALLLVGLFSDLRPSDLSE